MGRIVWTAPGGGELIAEAGSGLRLVVTRLEDTVARFVVEKRQPPTDDASPVRSGHRDGVRAAMDAAEREAAQIGGL